MGHEGLLEIQTLCHMVTLPVSLLGQYGHLFGVIPSDIYKLHTYSARTGSQSLDYAYVLRTTDWSLSQTKRAVRCSWANNLLM